MGIVSRGGSLLAKWMVHHGRENPMYEMFDEICAICRQYDVTYSLGDGLRPGCLADASDAAQFAELDALGELVAAGLRGRRAGDGRRPRPRAVRPDRHEHAAPAAGVRRRAVLRAGPAGHRRIPRLRPHHRRPSARPRPPTTVRASCATSRPTEHLGLPKAEDVKQGCIAYKIAAHAADVARDLPGAATGTTTCPSARADLDWPSQFELAFDGETARAIHRRDLTSDDDDYCSMCGRDWCAVRISKEVTSKLKGR